MFIIVCKMLEFLSSANNSSELGLASSLLQDVYHPFPAPVPGLIPEVKPSSRKLVSTIMTIILVFPPLRLMQVGPLQKIQPFAQNTCPLSVL